MAVSKRMVKIRPATAFPFTLGVFTGTLLTAFLVLALRSMDELDNPIPTHNDPSNLPLVVTPPQIEVSRPKKALQVLETHKTISYNVLTSSEFLQKRVLPIHKTWGVGQELQFYLHPPQGEHEIDFVTKKKLPLVPLEGIDSRHGRGIYSMWMDVCERKSSKFNWFMKVRDDAYVNTEALERLLISLNSSESLLIGQSVLPTGEERDKLGLKEEEGYCIESGYVVSLGAMEQLCPVLSWCWENAKSDNEDVELARCIRLSSGANCTTAKEMEELFYTAEDEIDEEQLQLGEHDLNPAIQKALLVSPLKEPDHFYHYHLYQARGKLVNKKENIKELRAHLLKVAEFSAQRSSGEQHYPPWTKLGVSSPYFPRSKDEVIHFQMFDKQFKYTESLHYPIHTMSPDERENTKKIARAVTRALTNSTDTQALQFHSLIQRFDPQRGIDGFSQVLNTKTNQSHLVHTLREVEPPRVLSAYMAGYRSTKVNFVVAAPLVSRGFQRFIMSFESSFLARDPPESVGLLVILYSEDGLFKRFDEDLQAVTSLLKLYKGKYPEADLRFVSTRGSHSRLESLRIASQEFPGYELLFLADIHIDFSAKFLERCRMNALESRQVYFPVIFNPYNPDEFYKARILHPYATKFQITASLGSWMHESYHIACVYNYDLLSALELQSEQSKSLTLIELFLQINKLTVFRSVEPGLVHLWQDGCRDEHLGSSEQTLCESLDNALKVS